MKLWKAEQIGSGAWCILVQDEDSFYIAEGDDCAAVIDTGITQGGWFS